MSDPKKVAEALNALADVLEQHDASIELGYDGTGLWLEIGGSWVVELPMDNTPAALRQLAKESI